MVIAIVVIIYVLERKLYLVLVNSMLYFWIYYEQKDWGYYVTNKQT